MTDQYIGEIRIVPFTFAPTNWAKCDGQVLPIASNPTLFSLIGTSYGGNGTTNFALPDLRGLGAMAWGAGAGLTPRSIGEPGGSPTVTLTIEELPKHAHFLQGDTSGATSTTPEDTVLSVPATGPRQPNQLYNPAAPSVPMMENSTSYTGQNMSHENRQPYLTLNFIIATSGLYPDHL
jgi:microcystin-dependent protein